MTASASLGAVQTVSGQRTDLVVPAALLPGLRVPPLAVTDGSADPGWADVPLTAWRFKRTPTLRLPLDRRTAARVRRYARLTPWSPLPAIVVLAAVAIWEYVDLPRPWNEVLILAAGGAQVIWTLLRGGLPPQAPSRNRLGDLRIPSVPVEVAREWVASNPGVTATDEPEPRPHSRRFYIAWAAGLLVTAVALAAILANDGREDFFLLWLLVPVLAVLGVSTAAKTLPQDGPGPTFPV